MTKRRGRTAGSCGAIRFPWGCVMGYYIVRRVLSVTPTLLGVTFAVFMFVHVLPGDPARLMAGMDATADSLQSVRKSLGLDRPLWVQYGIYLNGWPTGTSVYQIGIRRP